jgi:hypothetical protein
VSHRRQAVVLGFELRVSVLLDRPLPLEPHLQPFLLWLLWRWGLENYAQVDLEPPSSRSCSLSG